MTKPEISRYALNNYRMASYLLFAIGLINLRYQTGKTDVLVNSAAIFIPGFIAFTLTFIKSAHGFLARREAMVALGVIGAALVAWAISN
jgi:NAD(P)-dependent dehydrogenase (short-subunit alcohol dehydrogenase family)